MPNAALTVPDELAGDIIFPTLDESLLDGLYLDVGPGDGDALNWTSQLPSDSRLSERPEPPREEPSTLYEDDLGLDFNFDEGPSIEAGRPAPAPRPVGEDLVDDTPRLYEDDLGLNFDEETPAPEINTIDPAVPPVEDRMALDFEETDMPAATNGTGFLNGDQDGAGARRISQSPLSSARSSVIRDMEHSRFTDEPTARARQPAAKRRKLLPIDAETTLHRSQIVAQQEDHSAILKPASFLPKDPLLLTLMTMQQNGSFVSSVMNGGHLRGLAPQLRGILSIEAVRKASAAPKRKRDSGVADVGEDAEPANEPMPPADEAPQPQDEAVADLSRHDKTMEIPDDGILPDLDDGPAAFGGDDDAPMTPAAGGAFDETTAPLLHPDEQGPISVGTQHAVHVLRAHFGGSAAAAAQRPNVLFQDLYPAAKTSRAEATQMFFETLVLATKDAIKVEQPADALGGPIRIRPKRSLWGSWAEKEAGGEIAAEAQEGKMEVAAA